MNDNARLSGFPEYILARRSPLGKVVFDKPYFVLVEAKKDNFDNAWGQCLAEMVAAQRLNENRDIVVYGIASNGDFWQFGQLKHAKFVKHSRPYSLYELDRLLAAVNYIFQPANSQLEALIAA